MRRQLQRVAEIPSHTLSSCPKFTLKTVNFKSFGKSNQYHISGDKLPQVFIGALLLLRLLRHYNKISRRLIVTRTVVRTANHVFPLFSPSSFSTVSSAELRYVPSRDRKPFPGHKPVLAVLYYSSTVQS